MASCVAGGLIHREIARGFEPNSRPSLRLPDGQALENDGTPRGPCHTALLLSRETLAPTSATTGHRKLEASQRFPYSRRTSRKKYPRKPRSVAARSERRKGERPHSASRALGGS